MEEGMEDAAAAGSWILFFVLLAIDFIFNGFGTAFQKLNGSELERRWEQERDKRSKRLLQMAKNPARYVNTVQLVVILVQIIVGAFFWKIWQETTDRLLLKAAGSGIGDGFRMTVHIIAIVLTGFFLLFVLLLFGVLIPRKIASRYPEKFAYLWSMPTYCACQILAPFTGLFNLISDALLRLIGLKPTKTTPDVTEEAIISMVNEGHEQGVLEESEAEMITNIFEFGDKTAKDIMTNRQNMIMLDSRMNLSDAVAAMLEENNSRFPVYSDTPDQIIGILHVKDACRMETKLRTMENKPGSGVQNGNPALKNCRQILRKPEFVPETMQIDDLFHSMQVKRLQMVIVVDEYGQTVGLVAMEDILEEIVGNIEDEYDREERHMIRIGEQSYMADGMTTLDELAEILNISFDENIEVDTLNGFMILHLQHIPDEKEQFAFDYQGFEFKIQTVSKRVIQKVRITKLAEPDIEESESVGAAKEVEEAGE